MRNSMAFPIRFWAIVLAILLAYQFSTDISADWCKYEKQINLTLDLQDSSGDISVEDIGGDFRVLTDGSGSIRSRNVAGEIQTPEDS